MSAEAFSWAMRQVTGSPITKLVLLKLGDHAHADGGGCWPSVATIAEGTELSERAVRQHLRILEDELGLIVSEPRIEENGQRSNLYRLNISREAGEKIPPARRAGGRNITPSKRRDVQAPPAPSAGGPRQEVPGHSKDSNQQKEPSKESAPKRALPLDGRALRLAKQIGEAKWQAWFSDANFHDGDPPRITMPSKFKRGCVLERFGIEIRRVFGDGVVIAVAPSLSDVPVADERPWWTR